MPARKNPVPGDKIEQTVLQSADGRLGQVVCHYMHLVFQPALLIASMQAGDALGSHVYAAHLGILLQCAQDCLIRQIVTLEALDKLHAVTRDAERGGIRQSFDPAAVGLEFQIPGNGKDVCHARPDCAKAARRQLSAFGKVLPDMAYAAAGRQVGIIGHNRNAPGGELLNFAAQQDVIGGVQLLSRLRRRRAVRRCAGCIRGRSGCPMVSM